MTVKNFFYRLIRGWFPEETQMPKSLLQKQNMPVSAYLKFTTPLKIAYGLTLGFAAAVFVSWMIMHYWQDWTPTIFWSYIYALPFLFFINAIPLAIFTALFLTKGNGLNYFKNWNATKLQFSGITIAAGYISIMLIHFLRIRLYIVQFESDGGFSTPQINPLFLNLVFLGLCIMAVGFASLLLTYRTNGTSEKTAEPKEKNQKKTTKKTAALVVIIVILAVSLACLTGAHLKLQGSYDALSENHEFTTQPKAWIVNEHWTDNVDGDSKYVNYQGGVLNFGYKTASNVTLIVSIRGPDDTLLKREEIFIGDLHVLHYHQVDVNIEYSGQLDHVSAGTRWD